MTNTSITFGLEIGYYDSVAESDAGKEVILRTPRLAVFSSVSKAIAEKEGINIVEGDLWFFAFDGSPLAACFSEEPYIGTGTGKYFPGIYTLQPARGENLRDVIAKIIAENPSPHTQIVVHIPDTDESVQKYGWSDVKAMKEGLTQALKILPPDMEKRVVFE